MGPDRKICGPGARDRSTQQCQSGSSPTGTCPTSRAPLSTGDALDELEKALPRTGRGKAPDPGSATGRRPLTAAPIGPAGRPGRTGCGAGLAVLEAVVLVSIASTPTGARGRPRGHAAHSGTRSMIHATPDDMHDAGSLVAQMWHTGMKMGLVGAQLLSGYLSANERIYKHIPGVASFSISQSRGSQVRNPGGGAPPGWNRPLWDICGTTFFRFSNNVADVRHSDGSHRERRAHVLPAPSHIGDLLSLLS